MGHERSASYLARHRSKIAARLAVVVFALLLLDSTVALGVPPAGFQNEVVLTGLDQPDGHHVHSRRPDVDL
jgi:hypothetical protein